MDNLIEDGGFGAGEGLDFLDGFGLGGEELLNLEDLDKQGTLMPLDDTLTTTEKEVDFQKETTTEIQSEIVEKEAEAEEDVTKDPTTEAPVEDIAKLTEDDNLGGPVEDAAIVGEPAVEESVVNQAPDNVEATSLLQTMPTEQTSRCLFFCFGPDNLISILH